MIYNVPEDSLYPRPPGDGGEGDGGVGAYIISRVSCLVTLVPWFSYKRPQPRPGYLDRSLFPMAALRDTLHPPGCSVRLTLARNVGESHGADYDTNSRPYFIWPFHGKVDNNAPFLYAIVSTTPINLRASPKVLVALNTTSTPFSIRVII